ncbi:MAG: leucine-rich repeat protein [Prevotella sp.]|nr:leucine-rich repeat protein [Prevotella sp.]
MKRVLLLFTLLLLVAANASAVEVEINGLWYEVVSKIKEAKVIKYNNKNQYSGDIVIPETVEYEGIICSVSSIDEFAFMSCSGLTSVTISNSVTSIGDNAFLNCKGLNSVVIPNSVTSIGSFAFFGCSSMTSVLIGNGVTSIGSGAFDNCSSLTSVHISDLETWCTISFEDIASNPLSIAHHLYYNGEEIKVLAISDNVSSISSYAFYGCSGLIMAIIGDNVTEIGNSAFEKCSGLTTVSFGNSLMSIGYDSFFNCSSLTSITIPNSVTSIEGGAFYGCSNLTYVDIGNGVTTIGSKAFMKCSKLTSVYISDLEAWCKIDFQNNPLTYAHHLFLNGEEIKDLVIPNSLTSVGDRVFSGCSGLNSVTIPNSVETIGYNTFRECSGLSSIIIPNSVTSIGNYAFYGCGGLTIVVFGSGVKTIGTEAFSNCTELSNVSCFAEQVPKTDAAAFEGSYIDYATLYVPSSAIESYKSAEPWSGFKSILSIDGNQTYLLTYKVDDEVYKTYELEEGANISPEAEPTKEGYTFSGWSEIPETMPANDVTVTGSFTRSDANGNFGENITFSYKGSTQTLTVSGTGTMSDYNNNANTPCYNFKDDIKTIIVEEGVTAIGDGVFDQFTNLTSVSLPNSLVRIGIRAFAECSNLESIDLPSNIAVIDHKAFTSCISLKSINLPPGLTKIDYATFDRCGLTSIIIPKGVAEIGNFAFGENNNLEEFTCLAPDVPITDVYAFSQTPLNNIVLKVPAKSVDKYRTADIWANFKEIIGIETNEYTLTYKVDDEVYKEYTLESGDQITPEAAPTKEGYTFSGWSDIPETMPANDVTITGTFTINKYKLVYKVDGETYKEYEVEYGSTISPETAPTKEGYSFSGWSEIPEKMPANDVTVTGTFSINKYTLTYMVDGEVYKTYEIESGATITPEAEPTKEGYTFSGWSEIPSTMPANDVTVSGYFELTSGTFTLTYIVDGETYKTETYDYGTIITPEAEPSMEGYTFSGWSEIPETMPARDVTVTGYFSINIYTLTYMVDDEVYKTYEYEYGAIITPEEEPTKDDYVFSGWSEIPETMPAENVTVTGYFMVKTYTLTYVVDEEIYKTVIYEYGETITPEAEPTKEGYTFSGWSDIPKTMPLYDVTVTGTFTINKYKLVYQVDGTEYKTFEVEYGAAITAETEPTKEGYTFSGWSEVPSKMPAKDVTVTGTFSINKYKLIYMVDGEEYKSLEIEYGSTITPEDDLTKEGYTFSGWSEIPETMPAKDVTVTGTFTANKYILTYKVDGEVYRTYEVEYGSSITPEPDPTKEGHIFSGWSDIPETMPANDVTVSGSFSIGTYTLTYMLDGEEYKTFSYEYGSTITPETEPTKEGYTFSGWSEIPEKMPGNDVMVTGSFTVNKYKLTYMVDGEVYSSFEIEYGASITPESEPVKEGYLFSGWSKMPSNMPAHDVEVTGTFTPLINVVDDVTYEITGGGTVTVKGGDEKGEVIIEATVEINGQTYLVTAIANNAFKDNKDITSVTIADGIAIIGDNAFEGCSGLTVINIGKAVVVIGNKAFANVGTSSAVRTRSEESALVVNCYAESVPFTSSDAFENTPIETGSLFVEDNLKNEFKSTLPWSSFGKIYGFNEPVGIKSITNGSDKAFIFDMQGNRIDNVRKGVNIIRTRDGKTKKVVVK